MSIEEGRVSGPVLVTPLRMTGGERQQRTDYTGLHPFEGQEGVCVCGAARFHKSHPHTFTLSAFADRVVCVCGEPYRSEVHTH